MLAKSEKEKIIVKLEHYCAYRERCHQEVRNKLLKLKVYGDDLEEIMASLIENNFLSEERYARSFARGKHRMNNWGRNKIVQHLKGKGISEYCIRKAIEEIDGKEYLQSASKLANKYIETHKSLSEPALRQKCFEYMYRRGFEADVINSALKM